MLPIISRILGFTIIQDIPTLSKCISFTDEKVQRTSRATKSILWYCLQRHLFTAYTQTFNYAHEGS